MKKLAEIVSDIFDPRWEIPVLLTLAVGHAYQNGAPLVFLAVLLFIDAGLPGWFYWHLHKKKEISDWDITDRHQRMPLYVFTTIAHLGGLGLAFAVGEMVLLQTLLVFWMLAVMFTIITHFWKVSVHVGVNAALATYLAVAFGGMLDPKPTRWLLVALLYGLVVVVGWSRVLLKKHLVAQALVGGLLGTLGMLAGMRVVGL